jgi:hypothetical protein
VGQMSAVSNPISGLPDRKGYVTLKHLLTTLLLLLVSAIVVPVQLYVQPAIADAVTVPLETLPVVGGNPCIISATCPATSQNSVLNRGIQISGSTHAEIKLSKQYSTLSGTIFIDGSSLTNAVQVFFYDTTTGTSQLLQQKYVLTSAAVFTFNVTYVNTLFISINSPTAVIDIVADATPVNPSITPTQPQATPTQPQATPTLPQATPTRPKATPTRPKATPTQQPLRKPIPQAIRLILPQSGTTLINTTIIPFAWKPYPGARAYYIQIWLDRPAPKQRFTLHSLLTFTAYVPGTHFELTTASMPKGTYTWRIAALGTQHQLVSDWTKAALITLA